MTDLKRLVHAQIQEARQALLHNHAPLLLFISQCQCSKALCSQLPERSLPVAQLCVQQVSGQRAAIGRVCRYAWSHCEVCLRHRQ